LSDLAVTTEATNLVNLLWKNAVQTVCQIYNQGSCGLLEFLELLENSWNFDFLRNLLEFVSPPGNLLEFSLISLKTP